MKIGIVGWGIEGQSAYRYFGPEQEYFIVNEEPRDDFPPESEMVKLRFLPQKRPIGTTGSATDLSYMDGLEKCDKIVYSPTAYRALRSRFGDNEDFWKKAVTERHLFFETVQTKNIIGITGTKGKGTTSTLVSKMLEAAGHTVFLGGNIGRSLLDFVKEVKPNDYVVLELSSFQLEDFPYSPHIAVCLMISPEHLDYHANMDEYVAAKSSIFKHQSQDDVAIYLAGNRYSEEIAGNSAGAKIPYFAAPGARVNEEGMVIIGEEAIPIINTTEIKLLGRHNWQNVCAAVTAVWQISQNVNAMRSILASFPGLEHRLEFVRELNGVKYYDDSFGTNPQTAIVAMEAVVQPVILIAGGYDRGIPMEPLVDGILKDRVKHVIAIGQTGVTIAKLLRQRGFDKITEGLKTMEDIVEAAKAIAEPGDAVLLSAAATSFDMFKNFKDRGNQFKKAVLSL